jgi:excisionase family DNA binding protein
MEDDNKLACRHYADLTRLSGFRRRGPAMNRLLTITEAAALLGVKPQTLYLWVSLRRVPHRKIGRLVRFTEADLEEFVENQKQTPIGVGHDALSTR